MQDFKCVIEDIKSIKVNLEQIQAVLDTTLEKATAILEEIESGNDWDGEAQLVGSAFMDLVVKYHEKLAAHEGGPVRQAAEHFGKYIDKDESFYTDWSAYQDVYSM